MRSGLVVAVFFTLAACATGPRTASSTGTGDDPDGPPPLLRLPPDVRPIRYALDLEIDPGQEAGLRGSVEIEIELQKARRIIWMHGLGLAVKSVSVTGAGGVTQEGRASTVHPTGVMRVEFPEPVGPGKAVLRFAWTAPWRENAGAMRGRFGKAWYVGTTFEPIDARSVFPGFDEPGFKTPFAISLVVPDGLTAVSNAPEAHAEPVPGARRRVTFATTKPLPTYLVFFAVGDYEAVDVTLPPNEVRGSPLPGRILVPRGRAAEAAFAAESVRALVPWLERWFALPMPYEKLDHVVLPGMAGAMENAGAIGYSEDWLLWSPTRPVADQFEIASLIAHEVSHQWFGDLVTPEWWTDIWLNESFATWIACDAIEAWRPEWRADLRCRDANANVMFADQLASARAIRKPLERMEDVAGQFDGMSYPKGGAVIAMLAGFGGQEAFQAGIRRYILDHAHGVGSTQSLLIETSKASGRDLAGPFSSFIDQPGIPIVEARVVCDPAGARLTLSQTRYRPRGGAATPPSIWQVPVCVRYAAAGVLREACAILDGPSGTLPFPEGCPDWVFPNAKGAGYYFWTLPPEDLARLRTRGLQHLDPVERIALGRSLLAAQGAGLVSYGANMEALLALAADEDDLVADFAIRPLARARDRIEAPSDRAALEALLRKAYRPTFDRRGWDERPGEGPSVSEVRPRVAWILAEVSREPEVRREAVRRARAWLGLDGEPPRTDALSPAMLQIALGVAIQEGGAPVFDAVLARARAPDTGLARISLFESLGYADDPALSARAVRLLADTSIGIDDRWLPAWRMARMRPSTLLDVLSVDLDEILTATASAPLFLPALPYLGSFACSEGEARRLDSIFAARFDRYPALRNETIRAVETVRLCAASQAADAKAATEWIRTR
jgi:alanyl aminopeptidase